MANRIRANAEGSKSDLLTSTSWKGCGLCFAGAGVVGLMMMASPQPARAFNVYDGSGSGNNLEINLTTTVSYSGLLRVNDPSAVLAGPTNPNGDDGDLNFQHGIVGNLFEAVPVLDIKDGNYGAHVSGELYLNTSYLGTNQNDSPGSLNYYSVGKNTDFTSGTRNVNGQNARLLDAFVFGSHEFENGSVVSLKFGRQTLLWGQSLFFTGDGIAGGMAPVDIVQAQDLINPTAQQVYMPIGQAVLSYRINDNVTLQGYYQFEYQHDYFQGAGAYFNSTDFLDKGAERYIIAPGTTINNPQYLVRTKDLTPPIENGSFGGAVLLTLGQYDLGFYALRFDSPSPQAYGTQYNTPVSTPYGTAVGTYYLVYPRDIQLYGSSLSTNIGNMNIGGEISGRRNMPLVSGEGNSTSANPGNANSDPLYAVGDTVQAQISELYNTFGFPLDPGGVEIDSELEFDHVISITANRANLAPGRQASAAAYEVVITPKYDDVLPSLSLSFPVGIIYNLLGRSQMDPSIQHGTGSFSFGVSATYRQAWTGSLSYVDFLGKPDPGYNALADRGYVALNLQHSF